MTAMGIPRLIVSKILNHVDSSITAVYDRHTYDTEKKNAMETWGNKLKEIISLRNYSNTEMVTNDTHLEVAHNANTINN